VGRGRLGTFGFVKVRLELGGDFGVGRRERAVRMVVAMVWSDGGIVFCLFGSGIWIALCCVGDRAL
jgi:hypothetical protein